MTWDFEKVVKKTEVKEMATNKYAGTQTEKNLQKAFAGESQARNKYTWRTLYWMDYIKYQSGRL